MASSRLTGRKRYRESIFGKLILQVEEEHKIESAAWYEAGQYSIITDWRDATVKDVSLYEAFHNGRSKAHS